MSDTPAEAPVSPHTQTLAELFARDPTGLSDADIDEVVRILRESRAKYVSGDKTAGNPKKTGAKKSAKEVAEAKPSKGLDLQLTLDDLGL